MNKMKTYVLTVSRVFPATHKRKGESTGFVEAIQNLFNASKPATKIHTIRANYKLWRKRINEVNKGNAVLSIRYWSGKPYNSKQVEIVALVKCHVQKILFDDYLYSCLIDEERFGDMWKLSENDGLSEEDFESWFRKYDFSKPMAIIHFTNFRY